MNRAATGDFLRASTAGSLRASALLDAADVAGIYVCTTSEAHRHPCQGGIATALTAHAAAQEPSRAASLQALQASPHGALVYSKLGFWQVANYNLVVFCSRFGSLPRLQA